MKLDIKDVLKALTQLYDPKKDSGSPFSVMFNMTGSNPATYSIVIENKSCKFIDGAINNPKAIIITKPETWISIASGKMNPMTAIMMGRLNVKGSLSLLLSLEEVFSAIPSGYKGAGKSKRKDLWARIEFLLERK